MLNKLSKFLENFNKIMKFSIFYSTQSNPPVKSSSHLLRLITECITAKGTVQHTANILKSITEKVNSDQPKMITGDQPFYAVNKQLIFPVGFQIVISMLGPLYIR